MTNHGFIKVAAAIPDLVVGDCRFNTDKINRIINQAIERGVQIVCFPELSVTGYTCGDLFFQQTLIDEAEASVCRLLEETKQSEIIFIVGTPVRLSGKLFNAALVCRKGKVEGVVPKTYLPNNNEFYEKRWFVPSTNTDRTEIVFGDERVPFGTNLLFGNENFAFALEICEDLWAPVPPSSISAPAGAHVIFNLSASNELVGKNDYLKSLIAQQSARCLAGYVYASSGCGESTTDLVFAGNGIIYENGILLAQSERFSFESQLIVSEIDIDRLKADRMKTSSFTYPSGCIGRYIDIDVPKIKASRLSRKVNSLPFVPSDEKHRERCEEIFSIQVGGLAKRWTHTGVKTVVVGISGGLDSALALLVCAKTCDKLGLFRESIIGVTMPGYGTTGRTYNNALKLMRSLGVTVREIDITAACDLHFKDIGHDASVHDVTFENAQARERTQILMNIANQTYGLVIGTGDMSELALGWATYNGDHMSMYGVNSSIPKTLVRGLINYVADTLQDEHSKAALKDIVDTPVSPELLPANGDGEIVQRTEDIIGQYELHDFFLYYMLRFGFAPRKIFFLAQHAFAGKYTDDVIRQRMELFYRRFFAHQFKRSCMPDGPKVGSVNLSPRGDWRMPSDASVEAWLRDLEKI